MVVLKTIKTRALPEYVKALCIAGAYFVATASTQLFSQAGNNFAKVFPKVILSGEYLMILWFLLTSLLGFALGFVLFTLLHTGDKRASRLELDEKDMMEREEKRLGDAGEEEEIREQKSGKKL